VLDSGFFCSRGRGRFAGADKIQPPSPTARGRFFIACYLPPPPERSGKEIHMSRMIRKHSRNIQRQRRNKGPEMLSQAADDKLKEHAPEIATALYDAAIRRDAIAAGLLMGLAESAQYAESAEVVRQACSIVDKWAQEPQVVGPPPQRLLTSGS
jgi:hypothetical protein